MAISAPVQGSVGHAELTKLEFLIYKLTHKTIMAIEHEYSEYPTQHILPLTIKLVDDQTLNKEWCSRHNPNRKSTAYKNCIALDQIEAFYQYGTIYLRNTIDLSDPYDVGTIIHETVHYIHDRHRLLNIKCIEWNEYEALRLEEKLLKQFGYEIDTSYKTYFQHFKFMFDAKLNASRSNCR